MVGLLRQDDDVLLVQQQGPDDPGPTWALPGGMVEDGETLTAALRRELREETGLELAGLARLIYVVQKVDVAADTQSVVFAFACDQWQGQPGHDDPDRLILDVCFTPLDKAIDRLSQLPWAEMREPAVAYLTGKAAAGQVWEYTTLKPT